MDLEQLRCVLAVVQYHTFLEAAEELNRSQSSLSKAIRHLEDELGISIFERTTRRVHLTPAGEEILSHAEKILTSEAEIRKIAEKYRKSETKELRIGSIYFGLHNRLVPLVADYMNQNPGLEISMTESTTTPLLQQLHQRTLDVVFVSSMYLQEEEHANFSSDPKYISTSFSIDPYYVIVGKNHPLANRSQLTYRDLNGERLITTDKTMDVYHKAISKVFEQYRIHMKIATHCTNIRSVLHMVSQGVGIAILSRLVVEEASDLVMIPIDNPLIRDTQMVILNEKRISKQTQSFFRYVTEHTDLNQT